MRVRVKSDAVRVRVRMRVRVRVKSDAVRVRVRARARSPCAAQGEWHPAHTAILCEAPPYVQHYDAALGKRGGLRANLVPPAPRARSHCRFRNRGTDHLREYGVQWMNASKKRQCDRALPSILFIFFSENITSTLACHLASAVALTSFSSHILNVLL